MKMIKGTPKKSGDFILACRNNANGVWFFKLITLGPDGTYFEYQEPDRYASLGPHIEIISHASLIFKKA